MEPILSIHGLEKSFGPLKVLKGIDLDVQKGEVVCIIGASGSGKSTLLRCLNLLEEPDGGHIWFGGQDLTDLYADLDCLRQRIGMVFQSFNLFNNKNVLDNCTLAPISVKHIPRAQAEETAIRHLKAVGLGDFVHADSRRLSGGQKQRVAIARIFLMDPAILILDEATPALDSVTEAKIQRAFDALSRGRTTLIIAHRLSTIRSASRIISIADGRITESGTHGELLSKGGVYADLYNTQNVLALETLKGEAPC